jgi:carboxyl-terminal processing protease
LKNPKRVILFAIIFSLLFAVHMPVHAADVSAYSAGRLLGELIALISDEYIGGDVNKDELLEAAIKGMTTILDPYSEYLNAETLRNFTGGLSGKFTGLGVYINTNDGGGHEISRVLPGTPAREAGLKKGDIITAVNGTPTAALPLDGVLDLISKSEPGIKITVNRGIQTLEFNATKREIPSVSVYVDTLDEVLNETAAGYESVRYIAVSSISDNTAEVFRQIIDELKKEKIDKVIIDFRGNTGGYLEVAIEIGQMLVPAGAVCYTVNAQGNRRLHSSTLTAKPFAHMVVLADRHTASGAELIIAALQDSGAAIVVGENTYGKGVIQSVYNLSTGGGLKLTTEEYFRRDGGKINKIGVKPDYIIDAHHDGEVPKTDIALLKAMELLK